MNSIKSMMTSLVIVCAFTTACQKQLFEEQATDKPSKKAVTSSGNLLDMASKNLLFDQNGYNRLRTDLSGGDSSIVKVLYETTANEALTAQITPYSTLYPADAQQRAIAEKAVGEDSRRVVALALKVVTASDSAKQQVYLNKATNILKAWARINKVSWHTPIESGFLGMYRGYSAIRSAVKPIDRDSIDNWIRGRALNGQYAFINTSSSAASNWQTIRVCFLYYTGYILQDSTLINKAKAAYKTYLDLNILNAEGVTDDLKNRDAFIYHSYMLRFVAFIAGAVYNMESREAAKVTLYQKNTKGYSYDASISLWEPYLNGLYHDEFAQSILGDERITRRGPYNPAGDVSRSLDILVKIIPGRIYPYIQRLSTNPSRFANLDRYLAMLNNPNPIIPPPTVNIPGLGEVYKLVTSVNDSSVIEVKNAAITNGTSVQLYRFTNNSEQKWKFYSAGGGIYVLNSALDKTKVLDVDATKDIAGTPVRIWSTNYSGGQRWKVKDLGNGYYALAPASAPTKNLDLDGAKTVDGTKIQIWDANNAAGQRWKIVN